MRPFLQPEADERLHHGRCAARALLQRLVAPFRNADMLDHDVFARQHALQALQRGVVRAGLVVDADRHPGEVARFLERRIEADDRLRADRRTQCEHLRAAGAVLAAVDSGPFAQVVHVGLALLEQRLLQARERLLVGGVALGIPGLEPYFDARALEQAFVARDVDRQVEHRVVGGHGNDGALGDGSHRCQNKPGRTRDQPQTSRAVSTTRLSFASCCSKLRALPREWLAKPPCGEIASFSSGKCRAAWSMRRLRKSFDSRTGVLVETRPNITFLPLGMKRSGSKPPARSVSYSRKKASASSVLKVRSAMRS